MTNSKKSTQFTKLNGPFKTGQKTASSYIEKAKFETKAKHATAPPRSSQEVHTRRGGQALGTRPLLQRPLCREAQLTAINFRRG